MVIEGGVRGGRPVIFFVAVLYAPELMPDPESILAPVFAEELFRSEPVPFAHTTYYEPEMGGGLIKYFSARAIIRSADHLPLLKLAAVDIEDGLRREGGRILNIDPGYVAQEKVVAASTKNFTHRIYLTDGIYADLQLSRKKGRYVGHPWTYEDYADEATVAFFERMRDVLVEEVGP